MADGDEVVVSGNVMRKEWEARGRSWGSERGGEEHRGVEGEGKRMGKIKRVDMLRSCTQIFFES